MGNDAEGRKDDAGKPKWSLVPFPQFEKVASVFTHGEKKYSAENWKKVKQHEERYFSAAMRHLTAWHGGNELDGESGLPHLAHACCSLLMLMWFDDQKKAEAEHKKNNEPEEQVYCDCGGKMVKGLGVEIIKGGINTLMTGWECQKCLKTIQVNSPMSY